MTMLTDRQIFDALSHDEIFVTPSLPQDCIQPASVDVHLSRVIKAQKGGQITDPREDTTTHWVRHEMDDRGFLMHPGDFVLACTHESIGLNGHHAARFEGKSSLGRIGLLTHVTAGFIDPGFTGTVTLELANVSRNPIILIPGMRIGQICFYRLEEPVETAYGSDAAGSHYQGQFEPQPSRIHERFSTIEVP